MNPRLPLDGKATGLMLLLCGIWGLQQIALKAAGADMAPVLQLSIRSAVAVVLVSVYLRRRGLGLIPGGGAWKAGMLAGTLFSLEYLFVGEGMRFTNASHMVTMLYTAPIFAALGLHVWLPEERLRPVQWTGILCAFCGIAIAFYDRSPTAGFSGSMLWGDFLGLLGGMSWGATTVVIRTSKLSDTPAAQTVFCQLLAAACILFAVSVFTGQTRFTMTRIVWGSLIYQTLIVSFVSFLIWFWLLKVYLASHLGVLSFLTPVFGIIFGVLLLGETVEPQFITGSVLVVTGIVFVSGWQMLEKIIRKGPA